MSYHSFKIGVNVFILNKDNQLLLGKRRVVGEGEWGLPGGHLEQGETIADCAKRELLEETGLEFREIKLVNIVNAHKRQEDHRIQIGVEASGIHGNLELKEPDKCYEWKYFSLNELPHPLFFGHKKQIEAFIQSQDILIE